MYYKIENQECEVYKQLFKMRAEELQILKDNEAMVKEFVGLEWEKIWGHAGQQNLFRTTTYKGFAFKNTDQVCLKTWALDKENEGLYLPNLRTKKGREMRDFLREKLKRSFFQKPLDILGLEVVSRFHFPFIEIVDKLIILYLDDKMEPTDSNVIEITKKEFHEHLNSLETLKNEQDASY